MDKYLHMSLFFAIFAIGIVGSSYPMTREFPTSPFPINKVGLTKKLKDMSKKLTTEEFIAKARSVHGDKYDYSKSVYTGKRNAIRIACRVHGEFIQNAGNHLSGRGCKECMKNSISIKNTGAKVKLEEFIQRSLLKNGDKFDFSLINDYRGTCYKVTIKCNECGHIWRIMASQVMQGCECPQCSRKKRSLEENEFINRLRLKFGNEYDYSKIRYINNKTEVTIICRKHGEFRKTPQCLYTKDICCPTCKKERRNIDRLENFIKRAKEIHGDYYDYSNVEYVDNKTPVRIICKKHGEFLQKPTIHLDGCGCKTCGYDRNIKHSEMKLDDFIKKAKCVHGNDYDYSSSRFVRIDGKKYVEIKCNRCKRTYLQSPFSHLKGYGCKFCSDVAVLTNEEFIKRSKGTHGNIYDYSLSKYKNATTRVKIVCKECGNIFEQKPCSHISGRGCPHCSQKNAHRKLRLPLETWIERSKNNHTIEYDYTKVVFNNLFEKVIIGCPVHGWFTQEAKSHMDGQDCPPCSSRSKGENIIKYILDKNDVPYKSQWSIKNENMFCGNNKIVVDFYIPRKNVIIEFNGVQHYRPISYFGGEENFVHQQERDFALRQYCKEHKIRLIEISYKEFKKIEEILKDKLKI